ncbi:MAG: aminotransferase class I/II-fold pyridoxal phosphate-dependent enzyme [Tissierellia bacterium]|nr:aminotransferase class I/II-fold pyridoxal phosphate-dependent enzyme [Tissierellia bacterium]
MNKYPRIYLSPPHMSGLEELYIKEAFASNWIAPLGPHVTAFEKEVAAYAGVKGALAVSSGTAAIHLALRLLGVGKGDIVFCSSLTFIGSVNPVLYLDAIPVFIDSEPESWNMSPIALEKAFKWAQELGKMPKAVIIVDLYGQSADFDSLLDICNHYGVPVVEDAAEAMGSTYKGKACGTFGKFGIYSFNGNKIITTSGGGMLLSDDTEALEKALYWATQARDKAPWYQHSEIGYNYRMSNIVAAIGRGQLTVLDERVKARRKVFERYKEALGNIPGVGFMPEANFGQANRWLTVMTLDPTETAVTPIQVIEELERDSIECRPVWKPMHLQPLFTDCMFFTHEDEISISDQLFACGICLPSGSSLTLDDQQRVIDCIKKSLKK